MTSDSLVMSRVVGGLILGGSLGGLCRGLLQDCLGADAGLDGRLMEKGNDIEVFL